MLLERGRKKSLCPSESLRKVLGEGEWKGQMEVARMAARRLVLADVAEILQKGVRVPVSSFKGPIRVRMK